MGKMLSRASGAAMLALLASLVLIPVAGQAQVPQTISYQGSLTDNAGNPVTASLGIRFRLYDSPSVLGATLLWAETQTVNVANGAFDVVLGADPGNPLAPSMFDIPLYLGIAVGGDAEMIPRQALAAVGYSFRSLLPAGAVMFFDLPACPTGWTDLVAAQGRTLVGLPDGGTINGAVGTPLANLENRLHAHSVDPVAVTSSTVAAHAHSVDPPSTNSSSHAGHTHSTNPPPTASTSDTHDHRWAYITSAESWYAGNGAFMFDFAEGSGFATGLNHRYGVAVSGASTGTRSYYTGTDTHNHSIDIGSVISSTGGGHSHGVDVPGFSSGSNGSHAHSVDVGATAATTAGTVNVMPYLQLRVCRKD